MKRLAALFLIIAFGALSSHGQLFDVPEDPWSGDLGLGLGFAMTSLSDNTYTGYKPNLAVAAGLGYQLNPSLRLRGWILNGFLNGNDDLRFYQTQVIEGNLALEYNLIHLIEKNTNFKLNLLGGLGYGLLTGHLYEIGTRRRITSTPGQEGNIFSYHVQGLVGLNVGIPIDKSLDLKLGYTHRIPWQQPWVDTYDGGEFTDMYGMVNLGFTVYLRDPRDKSKMEVDPKRYKNLQLKADSLDMVADMRRINQEKMARLEMNIQEQEVQIAALQAKVDTVQERNEELMETLEEGGQLVVKGGGKTGSGDKVIRSRPSGEDKDERMVSKEVMDNVMYRVVIGSLPSRKAAENFMNRSGLEDQEMFVAYVESLDTYRVVYKSASTYELARKYLLEAKKTFKDAWVIEF